MTNQYPLKKPHRCGFSAYANGSRNFDHLNYFGHIVAKILSPVKIVPELFCKFEAAVDHMIGSSAYLRKNKKTQNFFLKFATCFAVDFAILHVIYYKEIGRIAFSWPA